MAKLDEKEVTGQEFVIEELKNMRQAIDRIGTAKSGPTYSPFSSIHRRLTFDLKGKTNSEIEQISEAARQHPSVTRAIIRQRSDGKHLLVQVLPGTEQAVSDLLESEFKIKKITVFRRY